MAYFTAREDKPAAYCRQQVQQANVYVGIIGFRYGSPVKDEPDAVLYRAGIPDRHRAVGLPRLVFLLDENAVLPLPRDYLSDPQYRGAAERFRRGVKDAGVMVQRVVSPDQLETLLYQALKELPRQTEQRIDSGLERERQPADKPAVRRAKFVNPPPMAAPSWFQDRHVETGLIGEFLRDGGLRLMTVVGRGGMGKTAMVCRLLKALEAGQLPDDGGRAGGRCDRVPEPGRGAPDQLPEPVRRPVPAAARRGRAAGCSSCTVTRSRPRPADARAAGGLPGRPQRRAAGQPRRPDRPGRASR